MKSQIEVSRAWAEVTIDKWRKNLLALQVGNKGELIKSFQQFITAEAGGDVSKIKFAYLYYGKFVDMGAGKATAALKGKKRGAGGRFVKQKKRLPKEWYSKTIFIETFILGQIMQDMFAAKGMTSIKDNIGTSVQFNA